jgi:hypothetical protein
VVVVVEDKELVEHGFQQVEVAEVELMLELIQ